MRCPICKRNELDEGESCCMECEQIDDFIESTEQIARSTVPAERITTVVGCMDCAKRAAVYEGRCLQCDRKYRDGLLESQEQNMEQKSTQVRNKGSFCLEDGCDTPAYCQGLCKLHYQRAAYHRRRAQKNGSAPPPAAGSEAKSATHKRRQRAEKPEAVQLLENKARELRDAAYAAADAQYEKALEAIEIVVQLGGGE